MHGTPFTHHVRNTNKPVDVRLVDVNELHRAQTEVFVRATSKPKVERPFCFWPASRNLAGISTTPNPQVVADMANDLRADRFRFADTPGDKIKFPMGLTTVRFEFPLARRPS